MYCWRNAEGSERSRAIGEAKMTDAEAWLKVAELGLVKLVGKPDPSDALFGDLLRDYRETGTTRTGRLKAHSTKNTEARNARLHLSDWANRVAKDIRGKEWQNWINAQSFGLRSKLRSTISAVYRWARLNEFVPADCNPLQDVSAPTETGYEAISLSPAHAGAILAEITDPLVRVLVILIACTGMRISEALALTWSNLELTGKIRITRAFVDGELGPPKSLQSKRPVVMTGGLAAVLKAWRGDTIYGADEDFIFPSYKLHGKQPRIGSMIVQDYIRPAAIRAGVLIERDGQTFYDGEVVSRFGMHSLRHGLATWLADQGMDPLVIQRIIRHSNVKMTMKYVHSQAREAQENYLKELVPAA